MVIGVEDRVARASLAHGAHARDDIPDFAWPELIGGDLAKLVVPDFIHLVNRFARAERDVCALPDHSVDDANAGNRTPITVVIRIVDQRTKRRVLVALGGGHRPHNFLEQLRNADALLRADQENLCGVDAEEVGELLPALFRLGPRQIDLVQDRDDLEAGVHREKQIGERLRLNPL